MQPCANVRPTFEPLVWLVFALFGSLARGEDGARDVDVAVRLGPGFSKPGLDYFSWLDDLKLRLSEILGCDVDVVEEPVRNPRFQTEIDRDRAVAFGETGPQRFWPPRFNSSLQASATRLYLSAECGSIMTRNGSSYKYGNCGGTSGAAE